MDIQLHTDTAGFRKLAGNWNELLRRSENTSIFSRHEYLSTWLEYFGEDHEPFVVEVRDRGRAVGFLPLLTWGGSGDNRINICAMARFADYCGFVVEPGYEERVALALFDLVEERGVTSLTLDHFREETRVSRALVEVMRQRGLLFQPLAVTRAPYVKIEGSWDDFISRRSRNTYRDLRKKLNRLAGTTGLEVSVITDPDEYTGHVKRMLDMHLKLWFARGIGTPYKVPARRHFLEAVGRTMLDQGLLRFSCLSLAGREVAYIWCYDHKGVRHYLNAAWDMAHASLSPGSLLLINDLRNAFESGLAEYDMLGGEEPYKYRYATGRRYVTTIVLDGLDRPRRRIRPFRSPPAPMRDASPAVVGGASRHNLLITAHPDDEAIFFGALLRSEPETKWTHCLITAPSPSPLIREQRLVEFRRSCDLLCLEPVFLDLEEPPPGQCFDPGEIAQRLAGCFLGHKFDGVYSHGALGEYGHPQHAAVSLAAHEAFDNVWSLAGPLEAELTLREQPGGDFPDKLAYFRDVHHTQLYLSELVAPEERYVRLSRKRARLIHRLFFERPAGGDWDPALTGDELGQAKVLFAPLFDAYFSRSRCPAELARAARSQRIDVISPLQLRILNAALGVVAAGGGKELANFVRQLVDHQQTVAPRAAGTARELIDLLVGAEG